MGLYDWVYIERECPKCGDKEVSQFQTKDFGCGFDEYNIGDDVPDNWPDFIDICRKCDCTINAKGIVNNGKLCFVEIRGYEVQLKEDIIVNKTYTWNKDKRILELKKKGAQS